jgi:hypothetical protein
LLLSIWNEGLAQQEIMPASPIIIKLWNDHFSLQASATGLLERRRTVDGKRAGEKKLQDSLEELWHFLKQQK